LVNRTLAAVIISFLPRFSIIEKRGRNEIITAAKVLLTNQMVFIVSAENCQIEK